MSNAALATIHRASDYGINALIVEHNEDFGVGWQFNIDALSTYDFLPNRQRTGERREHARRFRDFYSQITERGRERGVDVYIMTPEISYEPGLFSGNPEACDIDQEVFWHWIKERMRGVYAALPNLAGFVLYLTESAIRDITDYVSARLTDVDKTRKLIEAELDVAKEFHRKLIVATFIHSPKRLEVLVQALRQIQPDPSLWILQYVCPSDWGVLLLANPAIGRVGLHPEIIAFDYCGENWGQGRIPFCQVDHMVQQWKHAKSAGSRILGTAGYTSWYTSGNAFGTPNEVNIYAGRELAAGSQKSARELVEAWIEDKYGREAVPYLTQPIRNSFEVVLKSYHLKGFWVDTGAKSQLADLTELEEYLWGDFFGTSLANWSAAPEFRATWEQIYNPSREAVKDFIAEKDTAVQLAGESLTRIGEARGIIEGYEELFTSFDLELDMAKAWRAYVPVIFTYRMWVMRQKPRGLRDDALNAVRHFRQVAKSMGMKYRPNAFPVNPARMEEIANSFQEKLEAESR